MDPALGASPVRRICRRLAPRDGADSLLVVECQGIPTNASRDAWERVRRVGDHHLVEDILTLEVKNGLQVP
jgi:hypothetical protein